MATFKAVNVEQLDTDLTNIANAIKNKSGLNENLEFPDGFIEAVNSIAVGDEEVQNLVKKAQTHDFIQEHFINYKKTSQCTLFANNPNITEIPEFDFSQIINFYRLFYNCTNLTNIHAIDTSNGENFGEMFRGCTSLLEIPPLNTSKGKNMEKMFANYKGASLPWAIDTTNSTTFERMFDQASKLEEITLSSTYNATNFSYMFNYSSNLKSISTLNLSNCTNNTNMFNGCGKLENISFVPETIKISITIPSANLTAESVQSIVNGLAAVETAQTLTLHANTKILQSQIDSANAKGWTIAGGTVVSEEEYYG